MAEFWYLPLLATIFIFYLILTDMPRLSYAKLYIVSNVNLDQCNQLCPAGWQSCMAKIYVLDIVCKCFNQTFFYTCYGYHEHH